MNLTFTLWATPALKRTAFASLFSLMCIITWAQAVGDYRSKATGNWSALATWERLNALPSTWAQPTIAQGYPGQNNGTGTVTIQSGNAIDVNLTPAQKIASLVVNGTLNVNQGTNNLDISNGGSVTVNSGGSVVFNSTAQITGGGGAGNGIQITISSGANLATANLLGFTTATGNGVTLTGSFGVNKGNKTPIYSTGANYTYNGADGQVTGNALTGANNLTVSNSGVKSTSNSITVNGTLTVNSPAVFSPGATHVISRGASSGSLAGNGTIKVTRVAAIADLFTQYPIYVGNVPAIEGLTVDYAGAGNQTVNAITYGNVIASGSGIKTAGGSFYSNNNLTVTGTATLDLLDWNADNTAVSPATNGTISVTDGAMLRIGGNHKLPQNYTSYTFTPASIVEYYGGGTHAIEERTYGNLRIMDNGTIVTTSGALTINGNLTIGTGATFNATNAAVNNLAHTIKGNWTNGGTFNASTTTITFNGSTAQSVGGTASTIFNNVTINNSSGIIINTDAIINGGALLTFSNGRINTLSSDGSTTAAGLLLFNDNAGYTGVSNNSYVNGRVRKVGNDSFIFPVGKNGKYVPISISAPSDVNDAFTAEYVPQSGAALGPISSTAQSRNLEAVSNCEYWVLDRTTGTSAVDVTLSWGPDNACSGPGYIKNPFFLVVAHFGGGEWNDFSEGTNNEIFGTATGGTVTWKNVSTFSPFTIGSTNASEATLPVTFVSFTGKKVEGGTQLTWNVGGEVNVKEYQVERSTNGNSGFVKIGTVTATGNSSYSYIDAASNGAVFYRIKNVDNDGHFKYSTILQFRNGSSAVLFRVVPTLVTSNTVVQHAASKGLTSIILSTVEGKVVRSLRPAAGTEQTTIDMSNLRPGLYLLKCSDGSGSVKTAKVIKQ